METQCILIRGCSSTSTALPYYACTHTHTRIYMDFCCSPLFSRRLHPLHLCIYIISVNNPYIMSVNNPNLTRHNIRLSTPTSRNADLARVYLTLLFSSFLGGSRSTCYHDFARRHTKKKPDHTRVYTVLMSSPFPRLQHSFVKKKTRPRMAPAYARRAPFNTPFRPVRLYANLYRWPYKCPVGSTVLPWC